jgi:hypothetical protein
MKAFLDHDELVDTIVQTTLVSLTGAVDWKALDVRLQATLAYAHELPLLWLRTRLGLSPTEERIVWLLLAHELSPEARAILRKANTEEVSDVTFDTLRRLVYGPGASLRSWRELGPRGRLRELALVERTDGAGAAPEQRHTFKLSDRVLALAHGDPALDPIIRDLGARAPTNATLADLVVADGVADAVRAAMESSDPGFVIVHGRSGAGRRSIVCATARLARRVMLTVDCHRLATDPARLREQLRALARESILLGAVPLLLHLDAVLEPLDGTDRLAMVESELTGFVLATCAHRVARRWDAPALQVELRSLTTRQRADLWRRALPDASESDGELLATMYPLAPALIDAAGGAARKARGASSMTPEHVEAGIRSVLDDRLAGLATRLTITQTWADLVLPDDQTTAIAELLARIRERPRVFEEWGFDKKLGKGLGVSALFSGPPGTGKTMTAGLIARELGIDVYQVDISKVVSKWIGETQKNLAALFDAAEAGHAILLFDEADALFGKRSDVQSSNDRHANQEVNYLLQRTESFTGICVHHEPRACHRRGVSASTVDPREVSSAGDR